MIKKEAGWTRSRKNKEEIYENPLLGGDDDDQEQTRKVYIFGQGVNQKLLSSL